MVDYALSKNKDKLKSFRDPRHLTNCYGVGKIFSRLIVYIGSIITAVVMEEIANPTNGSMLIWISLDISVFHLHTVLIASFLQIT